MATDINRVEISGNLTRDPELRSTASGMEVLGFGIASNDRRKNSQTGEWEDVPDFVDCTMFGKRAGSVHKYLSKGMKVFIAGKLHFSSWEREGQKRTKLEVIVDEIVFVGGGQGQQGGYAQPQQYAPAPQQYAPAPQQYQQQQYAQPAPPQPYPQQQYQAAAPQPVQQMQQAAQQVQQSVGAVQQQMQMPVQPPAAPVQVIDAQQVLYDEDIPF